MVDRSVSVPMTLSDLRGGTRGVIVFRRIVNNNACTIWPWTNKFSRITQVGVCRISRGHLRPCRKGAGPSATHTSLTQNYQIWRSNTWGGGLFLDGKPRPDPKGAGSQRSAIFPFYLCVHLCRKTTKLVTRVGRACILQSATHASHPKRAEFQAPKSLGYPLFIPTPFNVERPNSAW